MPRPTSVSRMPQPTPRSTRTGSATAAASGLPSRPTRPGRSGPHVEEAIVDRILQHRSTIVFSNSRRLAERLTGRLNEIYSERLGLGVPDAAIPAAMMAQAGISAGADPVLAKAHHGSVSKEQRAQVEEELKSKIFPGASSRPAASTLESTWGPWIWSSRSRPPRVRHPVGSASAAPGTEVGEVSRAALFPKRRGDVLHTAIVTERMLAGQIEAISVPSESARHPRAADRRGVRARPGRCRGCSRRSSAARRSARCRARRTRRRSICWPAASRRTSSPNCGRASSGTATWVLSPGGPARSASRSRGRHDPRSRTVRRGVRRGRVAECPGRRTDEEMVYESRINYVFTLGTTSWRIVEITHDRVNVLPAYGQPGKLPFWHGDGLGGVLPSSVRRSAGSRRASAATPEKARERLRERVSTTTHRSTCSPTSRSSARRPARFRPEISHGRARPRRGRRLARDTSFPVRHESARTVGAGRQRAHPRAPGRRRLSGRERRRHHRPRA